MGEGNGGEGKGRNFENTEDSTLLWIWYYNRVGFIERLADLLIREFNPLKHGSETIWWILKYHSTRDVLHPWRFTNDFTADPVLCFRRELFFFFLYSFIHLFIFLLFFIQRFWAFRRKSPLLSFIIVFIICFSYAEFAFLRNLEFSVVSSELILHHDFDLVISF